MIQFTAFLPPEQRASLTPCYLNPQTGETLFCASGITNHLDVGIDRLPSMIMVTLAQEDFNGASIVALDDHVQVWHRLFDVTDTMTRIGLTLLGAQSSLYEIAGDPVDHKACIAKAFPTMTGNLFWRVDTLTY